MIDIFKPLQYQISQPASEEVNLILNSSIEKYVVNRITCAEYIDSAEGFFRLYSRRVNTEHSEYVFDKTSGIYEVVRNLEPNSIIVRIDYYLNSTLMVGVYVRDDSKSMIGSIKGYRADKMTAEEFQRIWYGSAKASEVSL